MKGLARASAAVSLALIVITYAAPAETQDLPPGVKVFTPKDVVWKESPRAPGVLAANLIGDPNESGPYIIRARYPPNTMNLPHHHPGDEEITVLSGTLYVGHGTTADREKAIALPPGSLITYPALTIHYLFTRSETVEVEIRGPGPRANMFAK